MPRNESGVYSLPGSYLAVTGQTITAAQHNAPLQDLASDLNAARPQSAGGTGATSIAATTFTATGATTARSFASRGKDFYSIEDFGVVIGSSSDQTAAMQSAVDAMVTDGGGKLWHPGGDVRLEGPVYIKGDNVSIYGADPSFARFVMPTQDGDPLFRWTADTGGGNNPTSFLYGGGMEGIGLLCDGFAQTSAAPLLDVCAHREGFFRNLRIWNPYIGVRFRGSECRFIENIEVEYDPDLYNTTPIGYAAFVFDRNGSGASNFTSASGDYVMRGCSAWSRGVAHAEIPMEYGMRIDYCDGLRMYGNYWRGAEQAGLWAAPASANDRVTGVIDFGSWFDWCVEAAVNVNNAAAAGNCGNMSFNGTRVYGGVSTTLATAYGFAIGNATTGDNVGSTRNVRLNGVHVTNAGLNGVQWRRKVDDGMMQNCRIEGSATRSTAGGASQVAVETSANRTMITNNKIGYDGAQTPGTSASGSGINIKSGATGTFASYNDTRGNASAGVSDAGTSSTVTGNVS